MAEALVAVGFALGGALFPFGGEFAGRFLVAKGGEAPGGFLGEKAGGIIAHAAFGQKKLGRERKNFEISWKP